MNKLLWLLVFIPLSACTVSRTTPPPTVKAETTPVLSPAENTASPTAPVDLFGTKLLPPEEPPAFAVQEFRTDFTRHTVHYSEILSGGVPKDGIPAINEPKFLTIAQADQWLKPNEPVVWVSANDENRAYPLQILTWHEIVNDTIGGLPLAVTFCPLCNTAIAFERTLDHRILDFGTTGRLRFSNLIMYDRQTESWWQQASGEGIAGHYAGQYLIYYPATIVAWQDFRERFPDGKVLSRETGYNRPYGRNPYIGYDDINNPPFLYDGPPTPQTLPPKARVLAIATPNEAVAYPYEVLSQVRVINDQVDGQPILILWQKGVASALDTSIISEGNDVGSAVAYSRLLDNRMLTFEWSNEQVRDVETGTIWDIFGNAVSGPLVGRKLTPAIAINHLWFSWAAFRPDTRVYTP
uniref:DUF3179 domain-containing protein n=1 Tax=Bellilinea caldifistulae TaxID=360411 RepID=A0A7C4PY26_9CHLR